YAADQPVLVAEGETAKMVGDPLALVAAESEALAEAALERIQVEYEVLPPIVDPEAAIQPGAPRVHEDRGSNICGDPVVLDRGDVERGFAESDVIVEGTYRTPRQEHAYMEPEAGVGVPEPGGGVTLYAGTQAPMQARTSVSRALGIPEHRVRVVPVPMGGAFGGKIDVSVHPHLALLALKSGRPVRMAWRSEESFQASPKRNPARIRVKLGARRDGTFVACEADVLLNGGAYASSSPPVLKVACCYLGGPYDIPNVRIRGVAAYTNDPIAGAFRGFGGPQAAFALETTVNKMATALGTDPIALRLKNALVQGRSTPISPMLHLDHPVTLPQVLTRIRELAGPKPEPSGPRKKVGRGVACTMPIFDTSSGAIYLLKGTGANIELLSDGTAVVRCESAEFGEGASTLLAQVVAEELGLEVKDVTCVLGDTSAVPKSGRAVASRQAFCLGNAAMLAAHNLRTKVFEAAADELEAPPEALGLAEGHVFVRERPDRRISLGKLSWACRLKGIELRGDGWFSQPHGKLGHTFSAGLMDLEVDEETGKVRPLRSVVVLDVGRALNPGALRGQLIGGEAQGLGFALLEDMPTEGGQILTPSLMEYLLPTASDVTDETIVSFVEEPYPAGPYGAKGASEHSVKDVAPALVAALHDALGVWIDEIPATPEKLWRALGAAGRTA
ncbi:MAG: molybdopterin-dependent oxidoreductase, partial [Deltaproteobacteria bacterium]|nr:molybdopterin-dependent oxidoreductase [Deltaproteobacteria bacterium]